jgi:hypothetical protein
MGDFPKPMASKPHMNNMYCIVLNYNIEGWDCIGIGCNPSNTNTEPITTTFHQKKISGNIMYYSIN